MRREVLFAHEAGSSLRAIAEVLQVSAETVRTIVREERINRDRAQAVLKQPVAALTVDQRERVLARRRREAGKWRLPV
jgi:transposase